MERNAQKMCNTTHRTLLLFNRTNTSVMNGEVLQDIVDLVLDVRQQLNQVEEKLDRALRVKDCLNGDTLLDNSDICQLLGITKRTLQRYRQLGLITYYLIEGKTLYKSSEVAEFISKFEVGTARKKCSPLLNEKSEKQE